MRRSDRELRDIDAILAIMAQCQVMRLGLCRDGKPYVVPLNFAWQVRGGQLFIYAHSAAKGVKLDIIAQNPQACFEVDCAYQTLTHAEPCEWSAAYQSVIGEGLVRLLDDPAAKAAALDLLMQRYGFSGKPGYSAAQVRAVAVLEFAVSHICGKSNMPSQTG